MIAKLELHDSISGLSSAASENRLNAKKGRGSTFWFQE